MTPALDSLLALAVKSVAIMLVTGVVALAVRRRSAATRHAVWTAGLISLLALPVLMLLLPDVPLSVWPSSSSAEQLVVADSAADVASNGGASARDPDVAPPSQSLGPVGRASRETRPASVTLGVVMPIVWLIGVFATLVWIAVGHLRAQRLVWRSDPAVPPEWSSAFASARQMVPVRADVLLRQAPRIRSPHVVGVRKPVILIPNRANDLSAQHRRDVMVHELAHVRRSDCLTGLMSALACAFNWPNPLAWLAFQRSAVERELACDDIVLSTGSRPSSYAGELLATATIGCGDAVPVGAGLGLASRSRSRLAGRLRAILDEGMVRGAPSRGQLALGMVGWLAILGPIAAAVPDHGPNAVAESEALGVYHDDSPADLLGAPDLAVAACTPERIRTYAGPDSGGRSPERFVAWSGEQCLVVVRIVGDVRFTEDGRDVEQLPRHAVFDLTQEDADGVRQYHVTRSADALERQYLENGQVVASSRARARWRADAVRAYVDWAESGSDPTTSDLTDLVQDLQAGPILDSLLGLARGAELPVVTLDSVQGLIDTVAAERGVDRATVDTLGWTATAAELRGQIGRMFRFYCPPGEGHGGVWGNRIYTDDSSICAAAVHDGRIEPDKGGRVVISIYPAQSSYEAKARNGITSNPYAAWVGSFGFEKPGAFDDDSTGAANESEREMAITWSTTAQTLDDTAAGRIKLTCPPNGNPSSVWGTDVYTDDSSICGAAAHAGAIDGQQGGTVKIRIGPGQARYTASLRNGVHSSGWGGHSRSFTVWPRPGEPNGGR